MKHVHKPLALASCSVRMMQLPIVTDALNNRAERNGRLASRFCTGFLVCVCVALGVAPGSAQLAIKTTGSPKARPATTARATAARQRAVSLAREMADTVVPRYKVDAGGELVPDLRAEAAIILDPEINQVLW